MSRGSSLSVPLGICHTPNLVAILRALAQATAMVDAAHMDQDARIVVEELLERIDPETFADQATEAYGSMRAYTDFVTVDDNERDRGREAILAVLAEARPWVLDGRPPASEERSRIEDLVRVRASEGMPMAEGLQVYRTGARMLWSLLLEGANHEQRASLSAFADRMFAFIDVVSDIFSEVYAEEADAPRAVVERRSRDLLDALGAPHRALGVADHERAARLRFTIAEAYEPFVARLIDGHARRHHEMAARLRASGALTVTEGRRVVGLSPAPLSWNAAEPDLLVVVDTTVARADIDLVLEDLRRAIDLPVVQHRRGVVAAAELTPELMVTAPGRAAARLQATVTRPLEDAGQHGLLETLRTLVALDFDRGATSRALHVHRNSLAYRVQGIEKLTGLDLTSQRGRGLAWLATLVR